MHTMQKTKKPNHIHDLVLLFAIPAGVALLAAAAVYLPRLAADPKYDFIFTYCSSYSCQNNYSVNAAGNISKTPLDDTAHPSYREAATIHYYDVENDSTRSLTLEEAQEYNLNKSSKSPDGYSLSQESHGSGFLFWGDSSTSWFLKDGAKKKKIELRNDGSYYSQDITFLGWVEK